METVLTCPLGSVCEEAKDGKLHRCAWYAKTGTIDEDTGLFVPGSEQNVCSIPMLGVHLTELKRRMLGVQTAVEDARNNSVERQDKLLKLVGTEYASLPRK